MLPTLGVTVDNGAAEAVKGPEPHRPLKHRGDLGEIAYLVVDV